MSIREPSKEISVPTLDLKSSNTVWHSLACELVTPMYGGGVVAGEVDSALPVRSSSIRGQLRFWWRLLAKYKWKLGHAADIQKTEALLFGGAGQETHASLVFLRVSDVNNLVSEAWAQYDSHHKGGFKTIPTAKKWAEVSYALFPAQGKKPGSPDSKEPSKLIKAGLTWSLQLKFAKQMTQEQEGQVWEALRWFANFGGLGARTRRGLGAIHVKDSRCAPLTEKDIATVIGAKLVLNKKQEKEAYFAWQKAVQTLQNFRQGHTPEIGRNKGSDDPKKPGRSRWSEPDAIRSFTGQTSSKHAQRLTQGDYFPRAAFGLPIIFKFQNDGSRPTDEPAQSSLQPIIREKVAERMASPLILRPYFNGKTWQSAALLLPHEHIQTLQLKLKQKREFDVQYWNKNNASEVKPIKEYNGSDALTAFLNYFAA